MDALSGIRSQVRFGSSPAPVDRIEHWMPTFDGGDNFVGVVHTKGLGSALVSATKRLIAAPRSTTDWKTPRKLEHSISPFAMSSALDDLCHSSLFSFRGPQCLRRRGREVRPAKQKTYAAVFCRLRFSSP
jgi:hypothetical protein